MTRQIKQIPNVDIGRERNQMENQCEKRDLFNFNSSFIPLQSWTVCSCLRCLSSFSVKTVIPTVVFFFKPQRNNPLRNVGTSSSCCHIEVLCRFEVDANEASQKVDGPRRSAGPVHSSLLHLMCDRRRQRSPSGNLCGEAER